MPAGSRSISWLGSAETYSADRASEFLVGLQEVVDSECPSIVLAGPIDSVGSVASNLTGVAVVQMSHGSDLLGPGKDEGDLERMGVALRSAAGVFVDCRAGARAASALGANPQRMWVMPWGVDLREFPFAPWPRRTDGLRLISLRSFERVYDPFTMIRGFADIAEHATERVSLTLVGDGSLAQPLQEEAVRLGVDERISWLGRVPEPSLPALIAGHHLHVSASCSDGSSISLLQASSTGRPSVVTDIPANREWVVERQSGFTYPVGASATLSQILSHCAADQSALEEMGRSARLSVEYAADWRRNSRSWIRWLQAIES